MIASMGPATIALLILMTGASAQSFHGPESVTYDSLNGRYLVSNVLGGNIVQIPDEGSSGFFATALTRPLGMTIVDDILFVATNDGVVTFDLTTDAKIDTTVFPGMIEPNDVAADSSGHLFVTDSSAGMIFQMRISDRSDSTIATRLTNPNGIVCDIRNNRMLFCQFITHSPIKAIDLDDLSVTTVLTTSHGNFDGLAIDGTGHIYVSSWGTNSVYRYDNALTPPPERVSSGHAGPADIFYNQLDNTLAVPNYYSDTVDFIPMPPGGLGIDSDRMPRAAAPSRNYPNPFRPSTTIMYQLRERANVVLKVYDIHGREVRTLIDRDQSVGAKAVTWDGRDDSGRSVGSGVYVYRIRMGDSGMVESRKMLRVR